MQPISPYREIHNHGGRVYAFPRWVQKGEVWTPLNQLVKVEYFEGDEMFAVSYEDKFVVIKPQATTKTLITDAKQSVRTSSRHFGHFLNASKVAHRSLDFAIFTNGVTLVENGFLFDICQGVRIGVFFNDWFRRFSPSNVEITSDSLKLDVDARFADAETVDLDPSTVDATTWIKFLKKDDVWDTARDASSAGISTSDEVEPELGVSYMMDSYSIQRYLLEFDTSGLSVETAYFYLKAVYTSGSYDPYLIGGDLLGHADIEDLSYYGEILDHIGDSLGVMTDEGGGLWKSTDLVAASNWSASSSFRLGLMNELDHNDSSPADGTIHQFVFDGDTTVPYIEYTVAAVSGTARMLNLLGV
jgi:hypothetical protein